MESGTLLHIALLRKTSKARRKQRSLVYSHKIVKPSKIIPPMSIGDDNFTLCGWTTQQNQLKNQSENLKSKYKADVKKLRQSFAHQNQNIITQRSNIKTSQNNYRTRNRTYSYRNCIKHLSVDPSKFTIQQKQQKKQLKEINNQLNRKPKQNFSKINIYYQNDHKTDNSLKQNQSTPLFNKNQIANVQKILYKKKQKEDDSPQSFTNFINLNNIRARKFFKN